MFNSHRYIHNRGVSKGGAGEAIAPPLFGRIEGAAGDGATPHYYLYYYLPPHFEKLLTPLILCNVSLVMKFLILLAKIRKKDLHSPNQRKLL